MICTAIQLNEVIIYLCPSVRQLLSPAETLREQRGEPQRQSPAVGKPSCSAGSATHARVHLWFIISLCTLLRVLTAIVNVRLIGSLKSCTILKTLRVGTVHNVKIRVFGKLGSAHPKKIARKQLVQDVKNPTYSQLPTRMNGAQ